MPEPALDRSGAGSGSEPVNLRARLASYDIDIGYNIDYTMDEPISIDFRPSAWGQCV